jgi:hypothetical protein
MLKIKVYNRNLIGGRRPHKGIQKYGKYQNLSLNDRLIAETIALNQYLARIKNIKFDIAKFKKSLNIIKN